MLDNRKRGKKVVKKPAKGAGGRRGSEKEVKQKQEKEKENTKPSKKQQDDEPEDNKTKSVCGVLCWYHEVHFMMGSNCGVKVEHLATVRKVLGSVPARSY